MEPDLTDDRVDSTDNRGTITLSLVVRDASREGDALGVDQEHHQLADRTDARKVRKWPPVLRYMNLVPRVLC